MKMRVTFVIVTVMTLAALLGVPPAEACSVTCSDGSTCSGTNTCRCTSEGAECTDADVIESSLTNPASLLQYMSYLSGSDLAELNPVLGALDTMYVGLTNNQLNTYLEGYRAYEKALSGLSNTAWSVVEEWTDLHSASTPMPQPTLK